MIRSIKLMTAGLCAIVLTASAAFAAGGGKQLTAQEKTASDQHVSNGLAQEQAALTAFGQQGGAVTATADLQAAITEMHQARPIYHGYRARSMAIAARVIKELGKTPKNPTRFAARITAQINKAITDAQTALTNSGTTETPADVEKPA